MRATPDISSEHDAETCRPWRAKRPVRPLTFLLAPIVFYLLIEMIVFRSHLYAYFLDLDSTTGYAEAVFNLEARRPLSGKKEILVVGDSRMDQGFSAKIANQHAGGGLFFANFGINGTNARSWYYFVRDVDPHRDRYAAIAIGLGNYDEPDGNMDTADRKEDVRWVINRLSLGDTIPYTMSFTSWHSRMRVLSYLVFESLIYCQGDVEHFLDHPRRRVHDALYLRRGGTFYRDDFSGLPYSLTGLQVDWAKQRVVFPAAVPKDKRSEFIDSFFGRFPQLGHNYAFELRWLSALLDLYRDSSTRIIVFQAPRSPMQRPDPQAYPSGNIVDELRKRPRVTVIDRHMFEDLEKPEYFGDLRHLNATGRKILSPRLADVIKSCIP